MISPRQKGSYFDFRPNAVLALLKISGAHFQAHVIRGRVPPIVVNTPPTLVEIYGYADLMPSFRVLENFYAVHDYMSVIFSSNGRKGLETIIPAPTPAEIEARDALADRLEALQLKREADIKALPENKAREYLAVLNVWERYAYDCARLLRTAFIYAEEKRKGDGPPDIGVAVKAAVKMMPDTDFDFKYCSVAVRYPVTRAEAREVAKFEDMCTAFTTQMKMLDLEESFEHVPVDGIAPSPTPAPES